MKSKWIAAAGALLTALTFSFCAKAQASQTRCPVTGDKIDKAVFVDFQGQRIYLSGPDCREKFLQDADRYFGNIEREKVTLENIQTICPPCGMSLTHRKHFTDYKGRRVFFCSEGCRSHFGQDPVAMLNKLPGEKAPEKSAGDPGHGHEGHNHSHGHQH